MTTLRHLTWNQGDRGVSPETGWDVATLTERSSSGPPRWALRHTSRTLKGLAIDWNPDVLNVSSKGSTLAHIGLAAFSPNRGTIWVAGELVESKRKAVVICSHRLNDPDGSTRAFGPVRKLLWQVHAALDRRLFERFERRGYLAFYGGDINHRTADLKPLRRLLRGHYDAIGYTRTPLVELNGNVVPNASGQSDHARFIATYSIKEK